MLRSELAGGWARVVMRVGILTADQTRHRFFVNAVHAAFPVAAVGYEQTGYSPADSARQDELTRSQREVVSRHFAERDQQENIFFGHDAEFLADSAAHRVLQVIPGELNSPQTFECLESADLDVLVVYGTNLIRSPLLEKYAGRMINMHLGLSPYYRGTATNFFPLLNDEPEYVGATIHLIDRGIDSGPIIHHARPKIETDDLPHTIGCKAILAGIEKVVLALREFEQGCLRSVPQWPVANPRLYRRKDFHRLHVVQLYEMIADGLIPRFVARASEVSPRVRLID